MTALPNRFSGGSPATPSPEFAVLGSESVAHAAVPTLRFELSIDAGAHEVRSVLLDAQVQIAARQRNYNGSEEDRLLELFGSTDRWASTLRTLSWARSTLVVPPFTGATVVSLPVACTYDLEVTASRYLAALEEGEVPLEFMFSGSVFFAGAAGRLQASRIAWDHEVSYRMPVSVWTETMDRHFPNSGWLRLGRDRLQRLLAYKARHAFTSWDAAIDALLEEEGPR